MYKVLIENKSQEKMQVCFRSFNDTANGEHKGRKEICKNKIQNEKRTLQTISKRWIALIPFQYFWLVQLNSKMLKLQID